MSAIRKYCLVIMLFFIASLAAEEVCAQFGTSRRVARRTSRRTSRRVNSRYNNAEAVKNTDAITSLQEGCVSKVINGVSVHDCNGTYYQPFYEGTEVVYRRAEF